MTFPVPDVAESWNRIRTWLAAHAPGVLAKIRQPASGADIAAAQEVVGVPLPEDLVALWRLADGVADVWPHVGHLFAALVRPLPGGNGGATP